ncbi:MAG TPA: hypothetical protein PLD02_09420 [Saprospiraceae bacterium]|nr:hypothetical protein [Saprospiraceae bacterium]
MLQTDQSSPLSDFIFYSKYARYNQTLKRRESWDETVSRVRDMHLKKFSFLPQEDKNRIEWAFNKVYNKDCLPSMRSLQFGGEAIEAKNARIFNCSVRHVDSIRSFAEIHWLLLCGCGVGIGLSKYFLNRLPDLVSEKDKTGTVLTYVIDDTIEGWANSVEALLMCYFKNTAYSGKKIVFDYSKIRKKGSILKTGGGKAPGHTGLKLAHTRIKILLDHIIEDQHFNRMKSIHAYDILMHCADSVLSGGIRRSACSVIFDKDDKDMIEAKTYFAVTKYKHLIYDEETKEWHVKCLVQNKWHNCVFRVKKEEPKENFHYKNLIEQGRISWTFIEPQRARSNNSVLLLRDETTFEEFLEIAKWNKQFGEPGFVFANHKWVLFNPCFEIGFIPVTSDGQCGVQFCNLTTNNGKKISSLEEFLEAVEASTIIGTCQAAYTEFDFLGPVSKFLTEDEALIGVSLTGMMEHPEIMLSSDMQKIAAELVNVTNQLWAKKLGINPAARTCCLKPEGTGSLFLDTCNGINAWHDSKFIRTVQCNAIEEPFKFLKNINPQVCEKSVWSANDTDEVITFAQEAPNGALLRKDLSALKHLEIIKSTQQNWVLTGNTEFNRKNVTNNVSCTVSVKENEWDEVYKFIYDNRAFFSAVSLLDDYGDLVYEQAPFQSVRTKEDLQRWKDIRDNWNKVDYLKMNETEDNTALRQEVACAGGACSL